MTDHDPVLELADLVRERQRVGEPWEEDFRLAWHGLTDEERRQYQALVDERKAHSEERIEAIKDEIVDAL